MTEREKLRVSYEVAFFPPRIHEWWSRWRNQDSPQCTPEEGEILDCAATLHRSLPECGYASQAALNRLALYQAKARAFGIPSFIREIRRRLGREEIHATEVPAQWVRAIGMPPFGRG
jgi:hypothetical protein